MGDTSHLERMGRELKCPICLSLFCSAVSLSCNHVFCNACILKSMKVDATCPVCKIPYHRREIRGSPHMDSLVSIYKNMEDASGVNIFVSQSKPSPLEKEKELKDASNQKTSDKKRQGSGKGGASKRKEYKKTTEIDVDAPGPIVMNSSQTKKRVQLLQNSSSQSLAKSSEPVEAAGKLNDCTEETVIGLADHPRPNEAGNLSLSPFFWLNDENSRESLSQLAESDQLSDTTPVDLPSFSDLKDSDHESLSKADEQDKPNPGDMFDSEMFEWTQRPSSPEILPSPAKAKVLGRGKSDLTQRKLSKVIAAKDRKRKAGSARKVARLCVVGGSQEDHMESSAGANVGDKQDCRAASGTSIKKDENVKAKRDTRSKGQNSGVQSGLNISKEADGKQGTKRKRSNVGSPPVQPVAGSNELQEDHMESSARANIVEKQDCRGASDTSIKKDGNPDENVKVKRATRSKGQSSGVKSGLIISKEADKKQGTKRKRSSVKSSPVHPVAGSNELSLGTEIVGKEDQNGSHGSNPQPEKQTPAENSPLKKRRRKSNASSSPKDSSEKTEKKASEKISKLGSRLTSRSVTQLRGSDIRSDKLNQVTDTKVSSNKKKSIVDEGNHTMQVLEKCSTENKPLQHCDGPPTKKPTCAFCQSSEETEASGEMAHYHRGEPVSADFNGGSKVIHVHKNCAEWAPNVYFNDLTAVNLEVELTRSRRISCSCCGLKGAALGCYNKSCKNSFHVACAKLIPECKWDLENFVMLCPLDASSKLPCEETSPKERKRKQTPKGPLHSPSNQVAGKTDNTELQRKLFKRLPKKLVLCCSGLTVEEKTVIKEFAELAGVIITQKWEPSVTHVIASTDENGACKRTLKFMMGILEGKWILSIDWIKASMKDTKYIREEPYEISMDVHGIQQGPYLGRQRALNKKPKLFNGIKYYIMGDFEVAYKGYLQDLIVAAGGAILRRRPISDENETSTMVVYSVEPSNNKTLKQRRSDAEALAKTAGARVVSSSWVLDSIAGCQILDS